MPLRKNEIDFGVLRTSFARLDIVCSELENAVKQKDYPKLQYQNALANLRDELDLITSQTTADKMIPILREFGITPHELGILLFSYSAELFKRAFKNDIRAVIDLISHVKVSLALWRTRIIAKYESQDTTITTSTKRPPANARGNIAFPQMLPVEIELKFISLNDLMSIQDFLKEQDTRHFVALVIENQLLHPKLSLTEIESWPDNILEEVCSKLLSNEAELAKHFKRNTSHSFFKDFRQAFDGFFDLQQKQMAALGRQIQTNFEGLAEQLAGIANIPALKIAREALSKYDFTHIAKIMQATQGMERFIGQSQIPLAYELFLANAPIMSIGSIRDIGVSTLEETTITRLLDSIDPELERKRRGAWQTFNSYSEDRCSQAIHSMREVFRQLLDKLAPEEDVANAEWYRKPRDAPYITRKMRIRYSIGGPVDRELSESTLKLIESLWHSADTMYDKLSKEAHETNTTPTTEAEAYLKACESIILLILSSRIT
jgi:hypothetical protein